MPGLYSTVEIPMNYSFLSLLSPSPTRYCHFETYFQQSLLKPYELFKFQHQAAKCAGLQVDGENKEEWFPLGQRETNILLSQNSNPLTDRCHRIWCLRETYSKNLGQKSPVLNLNKVYMDYDMGFCKCYHKA